jgi:hypothetical protein
MEFANSNSVSMTVYALLDWLCGSNTNSATDLADQLIFTEEEINPLTPFLFPLAGREESLQHISSCFLTSFQQRINDDRNSRPLPVCTGLPGLGKTRLLKECATTVFDMTGIPGKRLSAIVSFGNDGDAYGKLDEFLGIQCSFAWRVLHKFFKAHYKFKHWMREKSPKNRKSMTLDLALEIIECHWSKKTKGDILVFVGIDEYQKLGQDDLNSLLDSVCDSSCRSAQSKLSFFCMLAGTDLNMARIARTLHPNTQRTPIRFLTHAESMKAIGPFISRTHQGFVINKAFAQNVFYLGGVPRLLTGFAKAVSEVAINDLVENNLRNIRMTVLSNLQFPQLSYSDTLVLLAISFTNTPVLKILDTPFPNSPLSSTVNWSQMISNGLCLIQDNGCVIVPYHLVAQMLDIETSSLHQLNEYERALVASLKDLSENVDVHLSNSPPWLTWESTLI